jgi:hypothetical protein
MRVKSDGCEERQNSLGGCARQPPRMKKGTELHREAPSPKGRSNWTAAKLSHCQCYLAVQKIRPLYEVSISIKSDEFSLANAIR